MELWGIDPTPPLPGCADSYQVRLVGSFPDDIGDGERFDCVVFNDVLEHTADPWTVLEQTHAILAPGAVIVVSIPNVRHATVVRSLLVDGRWDYRDWGILDRTHLRFFTRATAVELLQSTGFAVERVEHLRWPNTGEGSLVRLANRVLGGRLDDFLAQQYALVARPNRASTS